MSQFAYSNKKRKLKSQMSPGQVGETLSVLTAPSVNTVVSGKKEVGGAGFQYASSVGRGVVSSNVNLKDVVDTIFPRLKFRSIGYGYNWLDLGAVTTPNANEALQRAEMKGNCKAIRGLPGKQVWFESVGLPLCSPRISTKWLPAWSNMTVELMKQLAFDNKKLAQTYDSEYVNFEGGSTQQNAYPNITDYTKNNRFSYEGGCQKHSFQNVTNAACFIEVYELVPRRPMINYYALSTTDLMHRSVSKYVLQDYRENNLGNKEQPLVVGTSYRVDSVDDLACNISPKCRTVHFHYKVSKPIRVCLAPGETFVYTMKFPPFKLSNMDFMQYIESAEEVFGMNSYSRPNLIPKFSKQLVVRAWAEVAHSSLSAGSTDTNNIKTPDVSQPSLVQAAAVTLVHMQEEFHQFRYLPLVQKSSYYLHDCRDAETNQYDLEIMNEEIDGEEKFDV